MVCQKCGAQLDDHATTCHACGASQQQKKKNKGLLIGLIVGGAVLLVAIVFAAVFFIGSGEKPDVPSEEISSSGTGDASDLPSEESSSDADYEQEILESIEKSKAYVTEGNFIEALAVLDTAEQLYGSDPRIDEQREAVNVAKVLSDVAVYENEKNYVKAIECIENSTETTKSNADVIQKLNSLKISYKYHVLALAEETFKTSGYKAAIDVLNESLKYLAEDEEIDAAIKRYEEYIPVNVAELEYFSGHDFALNNNVKDSLGNIRNNVVSPLSVGWSNAATTNVYKLDKKYSRLSGTWFQLYEFRTEVKYGMGATEYWSEIEIYGDGKLLYSGEMKAGMEPKNIDLNIFGVTELKIYYFGGGSDGSYSGIADFNVQK